MKLADDLLSGNRRALARGISIVETGGAPARELLRAVYAHTGRAHIVGITGSPGAGNSAAGCVSANTIAFSQASTPDAATDRPRTRPVSASSTMAAITSGSSGIWIESAMSRINTIHVGSARGRSVISELISELVSDVVSELVTMRSRS